MDTTASSQKRTQIEIMEIENFFVIYFACLLTFSTFFIAIPR